MKSLYQRIEDLGLSADGNRLLRSALCATSGYQDATVRKHLHDTEGLSIRVASVWAKEVFRITTDELLDPAFALPVPEHITSQWVGEWIANHTDNVALASAMKGGGQ